MGFSKVRGGDHVIGRGRSPKTGQNIAGKHGDVTNVRDHFGDEIVDVTWSDGTTDSVRQENVSGTGMCRGRKGCQG